MSELARALAFVHGLTERAVTEVTREGPLTVLRTPDLPLVWDANHLRVEGATGADARALAVSAAHHGVPSMVVVPDGRRASGSPRPFARSAGASCGTPTWRTAATRPRWRGWARPRSAPSSPRVAT